MQKFKTKPFEHQKDALKKCWNKKSFAVFAEMGTGKTKIALDNACILYGKGSIDRLLVVAPKGTYMNWVDQEIPVHVPDYIEKEVLAWKPSNSEKYKSQLLMRSEKGADKQDYIIDGKAYCKSNAICILDDLVHEFNIQDNNNYNYKGQEKYNGKQKRNI